MRRRDLIAGAAALAALKHGARAQPPERLRGVGVLIAFAESDPLAQAITKTFSSALAKRGWEEGKNVRIDYRFAAGNPALFKAAGAELVSLSPDVILASTGAGIAAVRQQTRAIPIVFVYMTDPIRLGLVQSIARPGGNITGFGYIDTLVIGKWLQLLKEIAPGIKRVGMLFNPDTTGATAYATAIETAAATLAMTARSLPVHNHAEIERAIANEARESGGSLITLPDSFNIAHRASIIAAANRLRLPLMGLGEFYPRSGGLMSYWFDPVAIYVDAASYIDRILRGASPGDLPVQQPTKFSLIINLKTAKAIGLTAPQSLLQRADEVIE